MVSPFEIRPVEQADFDDIIRIANKRLGENYLTISELQIYTYDQTYLGLVVLVNGDLAGFALARVLSFSEMMAFVLKEKNWFAGQFNAEQKIGLLKTIAVDHSYTNRGVGKALTEARLKALKQRVEHVFSVSWQQKKESFNTRLLENRGLNCKKSIPNYWAEDSIEKAYYCNECGAPPCSCAALIYM